MFLNSQGHIVILLPKTIVLNWKLYNMETYFQVLIDFFFNRTCVRPVVVYGGVNTGYQLRELSRGCNVLCGTPGRMLDVIERGKVTAAFGPFYF